MFLFFSLCVILDDLLLPVFKLIKVRKASHHIGKNLCYKSDSYVVVQFNPIFLGSNFIFLYFKLIIIYHHTQKQRKIKFKPRTKLTHNIYKVYISIEISVDPPTSTPCHPHKETQNDPVPKLQYNIGEGQEAISSLAFITDCQNSLL